jgi:hypothetical protein
MADKQDKIEIIELFMAQIDRGRCYYGTINRGFDSDEHPVIPYRIEVINGFVLRSWQPFRI